MALTNAERLDRIQSQANDCHELELNLHKLDSNRDYCAFQVSTLNKDAPPKPSPETCANTDLNFGIPGFAKLPWSTANIENGCQLYATIQKSLEDLAEKGADSVDDVINTMKTCAPWLESFGSLRRFVDNLSTSEKREALNTMAGIAKLAANAKNAITAPIPLLLANHPGSVTLSQEQCACLFAHGFFCTYPHEDKTFNMINFSRIFYNGSFLSSVRLQCFLNYFSLVLKEMPTGCVSFCRNVLSHNDIPNWKNSKTSIPLVAVTSSVPIENAPGCLQVDFADEYIGGLVLSSPIDQEEVRFLICPEMIVSSLLCEKMEPLEAVRIIGAQRYNNYTGYRETFKWVPYKDYGSEPRDEFGRVVCDLAAIDALPFDVRQENVQYTRENIDRELNKAYAGFMSKSRETRPVATGNWGCGAFGGNKELKSLIQMLAAAKAGRAVMYCTFNDKKFEGSMIEQYEKLVEMGATVGAVYKALLSYGKERERNPRLSVYEHVYDSMRRDTLTGCIGSACTSGVDR
ncbi:hypothetical protein Aduo_013627 [Ancylostoma duodenale]